MGMGVASNHACTNQGLDLLSKGSFDHRCACEDWRWRAIFLVKDNDFNPIGLGSWAATFVIFYGNPCLYVFNLTMDVFHAT
jgi:hypothetical protein